VSEVTFPPNGPNLFPALQPSFDKIGVTVCERLGIAPLLAPDERLAGAHFVRVRGVPIESVPQTVQRARVLPTESEVESGAHTPPWTDATEAQAFEWLKNADNTIDLRGWEGRPWGPPHELVVTMQRCKNVPNMAGSIHVRVALFGFYERRTTRSFVNPSMWSPVGTQRLLRENVATTFDLRDLMWNALPSALALVAFLPNLERKNWTGALEFFACCPARLR
jgi:hypothetical protein